MVVQVAYIKSPFEFRLDTAAYQANPRLLHGRQECGYECEGWNDNEYGNECGYASEYSSKYESECDLKLTMTIRRD